MTGKELKTIRTERLRLTQAQLAERVGVAANTVARWERDEIGMRDSTAKWIQALARRARPPKGDQP